MLFKTPPYSHQLAEVERWNTPGWALFWQQGTGKTKAIIDQAAELYRQGHIDCMLVVAPNGVHANWLTDELPAHCAVQWIGHAWSSKKSRTKRHARAASTVVLPNPTHLRVGLIAYDAVMTELGWAWAQKFAGPRTLLVLDESQRIKTPKAKRTKRLVAFGKRFVWKRILSGTPVTNSPFDIWTQLRFLDASFWKRHGFGSLESFKTYFAVWAEGVNPQTEKRFPILVHYRNVERLATIVSSVSTRVTKDEVLDLPPKTYAKRYFEMTDKQARLYRQLRDEFITELDGELMSAPLIVVRLLRLQQITCGYLPSDDCERLVHLNENPRLRLLIDTLEDVDGKAIIFARFREDLNQICDKLPEDSWVRYDGAVGEDERARAIKAFQDPAGPRYFVGNPAACATGLTLTAAATVIYYSHSFNFEDREQSEDRAHRIGQRNAVHYIDLIGRGTVDAHIVKSLRGKLNIASTITGDTARQWI